LYCVLCIHEGDVVERWWPEATRDKVQKQMNVAESTKVGKRGDAKLNVDIDEVKQENDRRINEMSESEILKQQEELMKTLGGCFAVATKASSRARSLKFYLFDGALRCTIIFTMFCLCSVHDSVINKYKIRHVDLG